MQEFSGNFIKLSVDTVPVASGDRRLTPTRGALKLVTTNLGDRRATTSGANAT
jgi:hypothetical protein